MLNRFFLHGYFFLLSLSCLLLSTNGDCPFPNRRLPNGRFIYEQPQDRNLTQAPENYLLRFRCHQGYERTEPKVISCLDGEWTGAPPKCIKLQCPYPPSIINGSYTISKGANKIPTIGSTAEYSCDDGFELVNSSATVLECILAEGSQNVDWTGQLSECRERRTCSDPGVSRDGSRNGDCCFNGDVLTYSCNEEYELVGNETIECFHGGNWSSPRPRCKPSTEHCEDPPPIVHGHLKGDKAGDYYIAYDEVEVVCDSGFSYSGKSEFLMCEDEGEWEEDFENCTESFCDYPEVPRNGSILELATTNLTQFPFQFTLTYVCDPGFRLIGETYRTCGRKIWSPGLPRCEVITCRDPGVPDHGIRNGNSFNVGDKVVYKCFSAFELIGSGERYCLPNGQWSGELTRCNAENNYCQDPGTPISGTRNTTSCELGTVVGFCCQRGFSLIGNAVRTCLPERIWSGTEAKCLGPYDFDNNQAVSEMLREAVSEKAAEQQSQLQKYRTSFMVVHRRSAQGLPLQRARILNLNHPGRLIFYFMFDVSGSVREENFRISINFAKALVKRVGISYNGARAGALTFSSKSQIQFLPVLNTTQEVLEELDRIEYTGGGTATSSAFRLIREETVPLTQELFGEKGLKSVIFILTDGKANTGGDPLEQAEKLRKAGVEIYCIGITGSPKKTNLYKIASEPTDEHVFVLKDYGTLEWLIDQITKGSVDYSQCGLGLEKVGKRNQRARIVGGKKAMDPWPWMAALYISVDWSSDPADAQLKCGGSIIAKQWILTAAHCLFLEDTTILRHENEVTVKLGLTDVKNLTSLQEYEISKFYLHPSYRNLANFDYDIALLKLKVPIEFNAFVRPVCLPEEDLPPDTTFYKPKENAYATGWGKEAPDEANEDFNADGRVRELKELRLPIQSRERCLDSILEENGNEMMFTERMFCAGSGKSGEDTCQGDSGGPLMQSSLNNEGNVYWTQVGIISWGISCGKINTYGFYTHVHNLLQWVHNTMNSTEAKPPM